MKKTLTLMVATLIITAAQSVFSMDIDFGYNGIDLQPVHGKLICINDGPQVDGGPDKESGFLYNIDSAGKLTDLFQVMVDEEQENIGNVGFKLYIHEATSSKNIYNIKAGLVPELSGGSIIMKLNNQNKTLEFSADGGTQVFKLNCFDVKDLKIIKK